MTTIVLVPQLAKRIEEARTKLPRTMSFPGDCGFIDYSGSETATSLATLRVQGELLRLCQDYDDPVRRAVLYTYRLNRVCVTWSVAIDEHTGIVLAKPRFSGVIARPYQALPLSQPLDLQKVCAKLGMAEPRLLMTMGPLVQVGDPKDEDTLALETMGIDPSVRELWIPKNMLEAFQASLRSTFNL